MRDLGERSDTSFGSASGTLIFFTFSMPEISEEHIFLNLLNIYF